MYDMSLIPAICHISPLKNYKKYSLSFGAWAG